MKRDLEQTFAVEPQRFFRVILLDEDYLQGLYQHLALKIEQVELTSEGSGPDLKVRRALTYQAERQLPGVLSKLLRGSTRIKEQAHFDARAETFVTTVELPVIGSRVEFGGHYTWQTLDGGRLRRTYHCRCDARLPLVGGKVERLLLEETERSYDQVTTFTADWLAAHPEA